MRRAPWHRTVPSRSTVIATLAAILVTAAASPAASIAPGSDPAPPASARLARGKLLVASEQLPDPSFRRAVILMLEYDAKGALGVIVNRPTDVTLASVLPEVGELAGRPDTVFLGGPVARDRMIVLVQTKTPPETAAKVLDGLFITASFDALRSLARGPRDATPFRAFVGYAGWGPGQLDAEVGRGDWDVVAGDAARVMTRNPATLWAELHERAHGEWVKAAPSSPTAADPVSRGRVAQRSSGGVALPPPARNACRASTLAFTS